MKLTKIKNIKILQNYLQNKKLFAESANKQSICRICKKKEGKKNIGF